MSNRQYINATIAPRLPAVPRRPRGERLSVPCPECGSEVGVACVTASGRTTSNPHRTRARLIFRAAQKEKEESA